MDYFKHYSTASDSKSLNIVFDKFGHKGIAFWWLLLELCSENWDGQSEPEFQFHSRTVATKLKSSLRSVEPWLELCSDLGMIEFKQSLDSVQTQAKQSSKLLEIKVSKLLEIKTSRSVIKNNKKELPVYKEEDIDKDIDKEEDSNSPPSNSFETISSNHILAIWDSVRGPGFQKQKLPFLRDELRNLIQATSRESKDRKFLPDLDSWKKYFQQVNLSAFLRGENPKGWMASFEWLIIPKNADKVLSGNYANDSPKIGEVKTVTDEEMLAWLE